MTDQSLKFGQWVVVPDGSWWTFKQVVKANWARVWVESGWGYRPRAIKRETIIAVCETESEARKLASSLWVLGDDLRTQKHRLQREHDAAVKSLIGARAP